MDRPGSVLVLSLIVLGSGFLLARTLFTSHREVAVTEMLGIDSLIYAVESDIRNAGLRAESSELGPMFSESTVDLEINYTIKAVRRTGAHVEYKFVAVDENSEVSEDKIQKVVVHLKPVVFDLHASGGSPP